MQLRTISKSFNVLVVCLVFASMLVVSVFNAGVASAFTGSGAGTVGDPYQITTCTQLQEMNDDTAAHYILNNDIDCSATTGWNAGAGFEPIASFTGSLDGDNRVISNLFINRGSDSPVGLFAVLDSGSEVTDLGLESVDILGDEYVGAVAGEAYGGITNTYSTGSIEATGDDAGGLVGYSEGTISTSYSSANVTSAQDAGGLIGENQGDINNSYATGTIAGLGISGGAVGVHLGTITNSFASGSVTGGGSSGGLVGSNLSGTVTNSFWDTQTSGQATSDGGTGRTTAQMKDITNFTGAGWDFTTIWDINGTDNSGYPFFRWQTFSVPSDGDGISDSVEDAAPNGGDGNNDGTADSQQANVVSFVNTVSSKYVTLEVNSACTLTAATSAAEAANTTADSGFDYPAGLINFTANCGTPGFAATVTQYYYGLTTSGLVLRKYNPATNAYSTISNAVLSQVTIGGQAATKAVYGVTDGGSLDTDGAANGTIVDPVGLALQAGDLANTGQSQKLMILVAVGLLIASAVLLFKKKLVAKLFTKKSLR